MPCRDRHTEEEILEIFERLALERIEPRRTSEPIRPNQIEKILMNREEENLEQLSVLEKPLQHRITRQGELGHN